MAATIFTTVTGTTPRWLYHVPVVTEVSNAAIALASESFDPASGQKISLRLARNITSEGAADAPGLSEKEAAALRDMVALSSSAPKQPMSRQDDEVRRRLGITTEAWNRFN